MTPSSPQDVAVLNPLVLGLLTTVITIGVHAVELGATLQFVRRQYQFRRAGVGFWPDVGIMIGVILLALIAHLADVIIWAALYVVCGEFTGFAFAFYHSEVNYTSLGYGDVVMSVSWRLLGPLEATDGLLMFGVSTAMIFAVMQRLFRTRVEATRGAHSGL